MKHKGIKFSSLLLLRFIPHILEFPGSTCIRHASIRVAGPWRQTREPPDRHLVAILGQKPVQGSSLRRRVLGSGRIKLGNNSILSQHHNLHLNIFLVFDNITNVTILYNLLLSPKEGPGYVNAPGGMEPEIVAE